MKIINKFFIAATFIFLSNLSYGFTAYDNKTITDIFVYNDFAVVEFTPAQGNDQGCEKQNQAVIDFSVDADGNLKGQSMYAAVLTAATSGKLISMRVSNGCNELWDATRAYQVQIKF